MVNVYVCSVFVLCFHVMLLSSSVSLSVAAAAAGGGMDPYLELHGLKPDPFVQAAPLIVAMACRDGVAIVAAHTTTAAENSDDDSGNRLLYADDDEEEEEEENDERDASATSTTHFRDMPRQFAGPFRIHPVGTDGTVMATCGWRADGTALVSVARDFCEDERQVFGEESPILPHQLAQYMAETALEKRPLSSVALVALGGCTHGEYHPLWLVDVTGAYPVRALCVGGGLVKRKTDKSSSKTPMERNSVSKNMLFSDVINDKLLELLKQPQQQQQQNPSETDVECLTYFDMNVQDGLKILLDLLADDEKATSTASSTKEQPLLGAGSRLELAFVNASRKRLQRTLIRRLYKKRAIDSN